MTDILASMVSFLQLDAALTALVGARIYAKNIPPATTDNPTIMPCITYQLIDEPVQTTHDSKSIYKARVQLDAHGSYKSSHAVADALHLCLHGFRGDWDSFSIGNILRKRKQDLSDPDVELKRLSQDFVISYHE